MNRTTVVACGLLAGLVGCSPQVAEHNLQMVVNEQQTLNGRHLSTYGVVRSYADPLHYWIEDSQLNRVALEPHDAVADFVGEEVQVTGRFMLSDRGGRLLKVREIELREHK